LEFETKTKKAIKYIKNNFKDGQIIQRENLYNSLKEIDPDLKKSAFDWLIYELRKEEIIRAIKRGMYILGSKPEFKPTITDKQKRIYDLLKRKKICDTICLWSTDWLHGFMIHQPMNHAIILEVDADTIESVYYFMRDKVYKKVYMLPDVQVMQDYAMEDNEPVIISKYITRSPVLNYKKVVVPKLEKILVDVYVDSKRFYWLQGQELQNIYNDTIDRYHINYSTMFAYASRRETDKRLKAFLKANFDLPGELFK